MRRPLSLLAATLLVAWLNAVPLQAQHVSFGLKGGIDVTEMQFSGDALRSSNRAGFFAGPTLLISTPIMGLGIDVSALYDERDLRVSDQTLRQKSLLIPAHARLGVSLGDLVGVYLCAGPQFAFNLGAATFYWEDLDGYRKFFSLQETTLGLNLGGGVTLGRHLEGAIYYHVPLGKTADFTWDTLRQQLQDQTMHRAKSTANAWRIGVTYFF